MGTDFHPAFVGEDEVLFLGEDEELFAGDDMSSWTIRLVKSTNTLPIDKKVAVTMSLIS
jgi:hypothetical protein